MHSKSGRARVPGTILGLVLLLLLTAGFASAQPGTAAGAGDEGVQPYRVGEGDVLRLDVAGRSDISGILTTAPDGTIQIPVVGSIIVAGKTIGEIRSDLARRISLFDRTNPQVTISVAEYKSRKIFVLGAVLLPGIYAFAELPNVWDAIAEAGGPVEDADLSKVELIPGETPDGRKTTVVDVAAAIRESRSESLPRLKPGDTIRVPRGVSSTIILMMGAVVRPGPLPIDQARDLVSAISKAGGATLDARLDAIDIVRTRGDQRSKIRVSVKKYFDTADLSGNPILEAGDTVYVQRRDASRGFLRSIAAVSTVVGLLSSIVVLSTR